MGKAKRAISCLLFFSLAFILIAGCSGGGGTSGEADAGDSSQAPSGTNEGGAEAGSGEVVEFSFSYWGGPDEKASMEELFEAFNASHPNIRVKPMHIPDSNGSYITKLNTLASANNLPDLGKIGGSDIHPWAANGMLMDLEPLFEGGDIEKKLDYTMYKNSDGKIIGASGANEIMVLYYNKDLFDEAGVPYPPATAEEAWTWDEFVENAKKLTKDRSGKHPGEDGFDPNNIETFGANVPLNMNVYHPLMTSNGGGLISDDLSTILLDSPESIEVLQSISDLMNVHRVMPDPSQTSSVPAVDTAFLTRRVAMAIDGQWTLQVLGKAIVEQNLNLGIGVLPKFEEPYTTNTGSAVVIFNTEKSKTYKEQAEEVYKYVMNPEQYVKLVQNGLWMPNEEQWYTDEQLIQTWIDNPEHPAEYKTAVVDYGLNHVKQSVSFYWSDLTRANTIITPALDQVWLGKKTAEDAVKNDIIPKMKQEFAGQYQYSGQ